MKVGSDPFSVKVGFDALVNKQMIQGCQSPLGGFRYTFASRTFKPFVLTCPGEPEAPAFVKEVLKDPAAFEKFLRDRKEPQPVPGQPRAGAAQSQATPGFTVPRGVDGITFTAIGENGAPGFSLVSPTGQNISPAPINASPPAPRPASR